MSKKFEFPSYYNLPPFFTVQPVEETRRKQSQLWGDLILNYCRHHKLYELDIADAALSPLFSNSAINRKLPAEGIVAFVDELVAQGSAEWVNKDKTKASILWRNIDHWASLVYDWVSQTGQTNTVMTVWEIQNGDSSQGQEFHGLDTRILLKALRSLEKQGKAQVFTGSSDDNLGVNTKDMALAQDVDKTVALIAEALKRRPYRRGTAVVDELREAETKGSDDASLGSVARKHLHKDPGEPVLLEMLRQKAPRSLSQARESTAALRAQCPTPLKWDDDARMPWPFAYGPAHVRNWYTPSPPDWRDEVFYFLLVDRFSDGNEKPEGVLVDDLTNESGRKALESLRAGLSWDEWCKSGRERFQGGTIKGVISKLDYLKGLGVTTIWLSPVLQQCLGSDAYHGYGIQDFLDVDPRFGTRADLCLLVAEAHNRDMRVIFDVIFNHSGMVFTYTRDGKREDLPPYTTGSYGPETFTPIGEDGQALPVDAAANRKGDWIYPLELRKPENFVMAGCGNLAEGQVFDDHAEHKRTDFFTLRKLNLYNPQTLERVVECYKWLIALTDVDGLRIDTFKHTTPDQATVFTSQLKEFAERLHKKSFFLVAECAGGDEWEISYSTVVGRWLDAVLDIGSQRCNAEFLSKGLYDPSTYFGGYESVANKGALNHIGCLRGFGNRHMIVVNDHDHVQGDKLRFARASTNNHQYTVAAALQLFTLGIPCLYYGSEQNLSSGDAMCSQVPGNEDFYLREAMFGPAHPLKSGLAGIRTGAEGEEVHDAALPGFGPHMTSGRHVFSTESPMYSRISALSMVRNAFKTLRRGRQYPRTAPGSTDIGRVGNLFAWSRLLVDEEVLVIANPNGKAAQTARFTLDTATARAQKYCVAWYTGFEKLARDYEGTDVTEEQLRAAPEYKPLTPVAVQNEDKCFFIEVTLLPSEVLVVASARAVYFAKKRRDFLDHIDPSLVCSYGVFKRWFEGKSTDAEAMSLFKSIVSAGPWASFV
eukprot:m51a1_g2695 hypothetical protein (990) ;mRNA; f:782470-786054